MRLLLCAALAAVFAAACAFYPTLACAQETPSAAPSATASSPPIPPPKPAPDDPKIHKFAVQQFLAWQNGTVNRDLYSDRVNSELSDDLMDKGTKTLANLGGLQRADFQGISAAKGVNLFVYRMICANGSIQMVFSMDPDGKVGLIFFE